MLLESVDKFSKATRSRIMASIKSKDTKPELLIRKLLWAKGKRYRVHDKSIIGTPDISSKKSKIAVFIDGCFWHGCTSCCDPPSTNMTFWSKKITTNRMRRSFVKNELISRGWQVMEFWEHDVKDKSIAISNRIAASL